MHGSKTEVRPGVWRLRVYVGRRANGTPVQHSKTIHAPGKNPMPGAGARLADRELSKIIAELSRGNAATGAETVGDLLERFLYYAQCKGRSPTTLREYQRIADKVLGPELGRIKLPRLTTHDLDQLYAKLAAKGLKATSVRRVHALIGAALHGGVRWELVNRNVSLQANPPALHAPKIFAPDPDEVRRVMQAAEAIDPTLGALLVLAALTGARRGELCALRWTDIDWEGASLRIARSLHEVAGGGWSEKAIKAHQVRQISLDEFGLEILRRHRAEVARLADELSVSPAPEAFLFSRSPTGLEPVHPDALTKFTRRVAASAGVDTHLHALRHFSATQALVAGFDTATVGARLGHVDPSITIRIYSDAIDRRDRELAAGLGRTLARPVSASPQFDNAPKK